MANRTFIADTLHSLPAGTYAQAGIYVVMHREPAHMDPHEVSIWLPSILPSCNLCEDVRFSWKSALPPQLADFDCFERPSPQDSGRNGKV